MRANRKHTALKNKVSNMNLNFKNLRTLNYCTVSTSVEAMFICVTLVFSVYRHCCNEYEIILIFNIKKCFYFVGLLLAGCSNSNIIQTGSRVFMQLKSHNLISCLLHTDRGQFEHSAILSKLCAYHVRS